MVLHQLLQHNLLTSVHKYLIVLIGLIFSAFARPEKPEMHPEKMLFLIENELSKNNFAEAARLIARFRIRVIMDAACCKDASAQNAIHMLTFREQENPKFQELSEKISAHEFASLFDEQLALIEKELDAKRLPAPQWIAPYGTARYLKNPPEMQALFPSKDVCAEIRKQLLAAFKESLDASDD